MTHAQEVQIPCPPQVVGQYRPVAVAAPMMVSPSAAVNWMPRGSTRMSGTMLRV